MNREEALAICFANLKGPRDKDLLKTARALSYLKSLPDFGSNEKVGKAVGVSGEIVREFLALLRLPEPIQHLLGQGRLSLEQGRRLWQLGRQRPEILQATAEAMTNLSVIDSRHLVDHLLRHPDLSVAKATRRILDSKIVTEREFHVVAILSEGRYRELEKRSRRHKMGASELVTAIVQDWLTSDGAHE